MKKKMNRMFVVISLVAIILTTGLITVVYYNLFRGQVLADLKDYLVVVQEAAEAGDGLEALGARLVEREIRVTLIEPSGEVIFDNEVNKDALENHLSRPEIRNPFQKYLLLCGKITGWQNFKGCQRSGQHCEHFQQCFPHHCLDTGSADSVKSGNGTFPDKKASGSH